MVVVGVYWVISERGNHEYSESYAAGTKDAEKDGIS